MEINERLSIQEELIIHAFQSAGLVKHTRILAAIVSFQESDASMVAVATATILMAAAALEAVLSEAAFVLKPNLYSDKQFRRAGAPEKFEKLMGYSSTKARELWDARKAVAHAEPDHARTRFVGVKLNAQGAELALKCLEELTIEIWGNQMPAWFSDTLKSTQ